LPDERPQGLLALPLRAIEPNPHQPRVNLDGIDELAQSIRVHGVLQPLLVTELPRGPAEPARYRLIAGERRWRAATLAGLEVVPAVVKESSDQQLVELALIENIQRADLNALEEAAAYQHLIDMFGLTQDDVAQRVGKARTSVANALRLLRAPVHVRQALQEGLISEGHARAMLGAGDEAVQDRLLQDVIERGLSVRQTEDLARQLAAAPAEALPPPAAPARDPDLERFETALCASLGSRVRLARTRRGGRITIYFASDAEWEAIYHRLLG
jgi:ParB family chromosome partitioning protein